VSHNDISQAIKIKIFPAISGLITHEELGVYVNDDETQEIRWSEQLLTNTAQVWKSGILAQDGISERRSSGDTRRGGTPEEYSGLSIQTLNGNQLILRLKELGIEINGLVAELWEFEGDGITLIGGSLDSDSVSADVLFTGLCAYDKGTTWTENLWNIEIKNARFQRNACVADPINNDATSGNYPDAADDKNGEIVPITIGTFPITRPAKFIRTAGKQTPFKNSDILTHITPVEQVCFPVVAVYGTSPYLQYEVQLGLTDNYGTLTQLRALVGWWVKVEIGGAADGTSLVGKYRKIVSIDAYNTTTTQMKFTVQSYFDKDLCASADATNQYTAWISITRIPFGYLADVWPCLGFIDENSLPLTQATRLFYYDSTSKLMKPIASYGYDADITNVRNNKLIINVEVFENDPDAVVSFDIFPLKSLSEFTEMLLTKWGKGTTYTNYTSPVGNIFNHEDDGYGLNSRSTTIVPTGSAIAEYDKDDSSYKELTANLGGGNGGPTDIIIAYECEIDFSKILIEYAGYYLGINAETNSGNAGDGFSNSPLLLMFRRFMGNPEFILSQSLGAKYCDEGTAGEGGGGLVKNLPDFYYTVRTPDNSKAFYFSPTEASQMRLITGYTNFLIPGITTIAQLKSIYKIGLLFNKVIPDDSYITASDVKIKIVELALICKSTGSIKDAIYSSFKGRVIGSPTTGLLPDMTTHFYALSRRTSPPGSPALGDIYWIDSPATGAWAGHSNSRTVYNGSGWDYVAAYAGMSIYINDESKRYLWDGTQLDGNYFNLIENPIQILEHFKRLQCGIEFGDNVNFGKVYSPSIPIKSGTIIEGAYDYISTAMTAIKAYRPSFQITDSSGAWTDKIISRICSTFNICTYTDADGNECVTTLDKTNPSETITFADIKGQIGETQEPEIQDIFVQPILNYQYNYGSEKFDKTLAVQNVQAATYDISYTPGIDNTAHNLDATLGDGEYIWNQCKTLYNKYRQIEQCSSEFSDQEMISTYEDAIKILSRKVAWPDKRRVPLTVFYSKGKNYRFGTHVKIKLPHQTLNLSVECMVGEAVISKKNNSVQLRLVQLEEIPTAFFFDKFQDSFTPIESMAKWQDVFEHDSEIQLQNELE